MSAPEDDEDGDEELALALGRRAAIPPNPWEPVLRGEAELEQVAAAEGVEPARARAYFTPLEPERVASIVDAVMAASEPAPANQTAREGGSAQVVELASRRRSGGGALVIGTLLALAAGLALWWAWPRNETPAGGGLATRDPIPSHALEVGGWLKELRAEPEPGTPAPVRYRYAADAEFEWVLRPSAGIAGELVLRAFVLEQPTPRVLAIDDMVEIAASGAIRVSGTIDRLGLAPGRHTIVLVVARPDALPDAAELVAAPADAADRSWRAYAIELEL